MTDIEAAVAKARGEVMEAILLNERSSCSHVHRMSVGGRTVYGGDSLDEANAEFEELERKLLAGELG